MNLPLDLSQRINPVYMDRAAPYIRPYVYPVHVHSDTNCLDSEGSCVFIQYRRHYFLVTAGHVWLTSQAVSPIGMHVFNTVGPDAKGPESCFIEIPGSPMLSQKIGETDDNVDLAVFALNESFFIDSGFSAVPERLLAAPKDDENWSRILHGFPVARNKKYLKGRGRFHEPVCPHYHEEKIVDFDWSKYPQYNQAYNIPTRYGVGRDMGHSQSYPNRKNVVSPKPTGFSGGALWSTPSITLSPKEIRLHGIVIMKEVRKKKRSLVKKRKDSSTIVFSVHIKKVIELLDCQYFK